MAVAVAVAVAALKLTLEPRYYSRTRCARTLAALEPIAVNVAVSALESVSALEPLLLPLPLLFMDALLFLLPWHLSKLLLLVPL